jgi:rhodanese-related sulfurtransferase
MSYQDLWPKEFKAAYDSTPDAILIDVRSPAEIAETNIEGHIAINFYDADFPNKVLQLDKDKALFFYCRSGNRSGQACRFLATKGYERLYNLKGGMLAWDETDF